MPHCLIWVLKIFNIRHIHIYIYNDQIPTIKSDSWVYYFEKHIEGGPGRGQGGGIPTEYRFTGISPYIQQASGPH